VGSNRAWADRRVAKVEKGTKRVGEKEKSFRKSSCSERPTGEKIGGMATLMAHSRRPTQPTKIEEQGEKGDGESDSRKDVQSAH